MTLPEFVEAIARISEKVIDSPYKQTGQEIYQDTISQQSYTTVQTQNEINLHVKFQKYIDKIALTCMPQSYSKKYA